MTNIDIAGRKIGADSPCFIIAEAGVNHNGNLELARRLVDSAAEAGVDAVKFQTFNPEKLAAPTAAKAAYQVDNTGEEGSQLEMLRSLVLSAADHEKLMRHALTRGLMFLSTPFDEDSGDLLELLGMPAFKVSSGDLTNLPFLSYMARKRRPMLISTGMGTMDEVALAVDAVTSAGNTSLALLHCVSNYPTNPVDCNLLAMGSLRSAFNTPVGWSDHTEGIDISIAAVALGANVIEKHFTLDRNLPGPDHRASLEPGELASLVKAIRRVEVSIGDSIKRPRPSEKPIAAIGRKSLHWRSSLRKGDIIQRNDLIALRPGTGISPARMTDLIGQRLLHEVSPGTMVEEHDFRGA